MKKPRHLGTHIILTIACLVVCAPIMFALIKATQTRGAVMSPSLVPGAQFLHNLGEVWFILITLMMPTEVLIVGLFDLISLKPPGSLGELLRYRLHPGAVLFEPVRYGFGWTYDYLSVIVPFLASATGVFVFRQHFLSIPRSLGDAALIDGVGPWRFLRYVVVPMSWNTIGALCVVQFVYVWDQYLWPRVIIRSESRQVVQVGMNLIIGTAEGVYWGQVMAGALVSIVPPLLVFSLLQEQFMKGFALSSSK